MNAAQRKLITGGLVKALQDAGLRVQLASHPLQDRREAGTGPGHHVPRLLCTEGPLQVSKRDGRHDAKTCQHKPARLGADHGS